MSQLTADVNLMALVKDIFKIISAIEQILSKIIRFVLQGVLFERFYQINNFKSLNFRLNFGSLGSTKDATTKILTRKFAATKFLLFIIIEDL